jgi:hypothetical protein
MKSLSFNSFSILVIIAFLVTTTGSAQIKENLKRYSEENGTGYLKPLVDGLGASMNRGWTQGADIPIMGLRLRLSAHAMLAPVPDDDKTFAATTQGQFSPQQTAQVSTVVGSEKSTSVTGQGGTTYTFPGGFDINSLGVAVPQLTVGSLFGTEFTLRYFKADFDEKDFGEFSLTGYGVHHSISQYFPLFPVALSAGFFYQNISLGDDLLDFSTLYYGVQASKKFGVLMVYGGLGIDNTHADISYTFDNALETATLNYEIKGDNGVQITTGLGLNLLFARIYGDVTFGQRTIVSTGISLGL